jgi:hypothetical protein
MTVAIQLYHEAFNCSNEGQFFCRTVLGKSQNSLYVGSPKGTMYNFRTSTIGPEKCLLEVCSNQNARIKFSGVIFCLLFKSLLHWGDFSSAGSLGVHSFDCH